MATRGPEEKLKFGVTESQLLTSKAEAAEGDLTQFKQVQDKLVSSTRKTEETVDHLKKFAMLTPIFMIPALVNTAGHTFRDQFDGTTLFCLWLCWEQISFTQVKLWQRHLNCHLNKRQDQISQMWALEYLKNSVTDNLRQNLKIRFDKLPQYEQGPVTYGFLILH